MTDQPSEHPTAGRRRRHKSPAFIPPMHGPALPRLFDHMGAEDGPSSTEEGKEAKRQRSALPHLDPPLVHCHMTTIGLWEGASVGSHESVRFGEEDDSEFKEVEEMATHSQNVLDEARNDEDHQPDVTTEFGEHHGGHGSASLRECLEKKSTETRKIEQPDTTTSAALHSGGGTGASSPQSTNPPQLLLEINDFLAKTPGLSGR